ncbi:MAG: hypothetical protein COU98_00430 [Candidatus Staskawiczbacteria bacterium CG10_big_fil_rev_8_21_14_0_10_38_10]|uniref:Excinuclease ABC subunit C n=1 Tax=Candidatus Staskawiczbacteria bacterium CG10_big_fil_rev_8_21_14_0_10_38_10 TaxID=1974891 RepID=A0A2H9T1W7_9BACT|nr:MAG: hypothetical protein COU98_00430 [Candidatus Staskawiczbacteria bacterium CG10_big_fil_rev_8_21_14_0_10_38_10]
MGRFKFLPKEKISRLPETAGVYVFSAQGGSATGGKDNKKILYIGKAVNIKERVKNHFYQPHSLWEKALLRQGFGGRVGYIKTESEIEALLLEAKLIKKYQPKFNVLWRDDKNYFYIGITKEEFPTVFITHQPKQDLKPKTYNLKPIYIGPFVDGSALKQTIKVLRKAFPYRTCKVGQKRSCLWYQLKLCPGPCLLNSKVVQEIPNFRLRIKSESQRNIKNLKNFLKGNKINVLKELKKDMKKAAGIRDFEGAAKIRDQILSLERILSHAKIIESPKILEYQWDSTQKIIQKIVRKKIKISRIEAYDVSNIQGKEATGAMVTFIKGLPDKNYYRRFKIRIAGKPNDTAMIKEVLKRRFLHPEWNYPDLILIDGGRAQLNAAVMIKNKKRRTKKIFVVTLAKKENELYLEGRREPILLKSLPRGIFNLTLQLRDEAHRFAIAYHRKLRIKKLLN